MVGDQRDGTAVRAGQVFAAHAAAVAAGDLEAIMARYAPDAVLAEPGRVVRGHTEIRAVHAATLETAAALRPVLEVHESGDVVYVSWRATDPAGQHLVGTNTFVIRNGLIEVNTAFLTVDETGGGTRLGRDEAMTTLDPAEGHLVLINTFTVEPSRAEELLAALSRATEDGMRQRPGFVSANLHVSRDCRYVTNYAQWRTQADLDAMMGDPSAQAHMQEAAAIATSFDPIYYDLRETHGPI